MNCPVVKLQKIWRAVLIGLIGSSLLSCAQTEDSPEFIALKADVAQKLMIDMRYFCADSPDAKKCKQPVLSLNDDLRGMLTRTQVGGVILFAENLSGVDQILSLNHDLQQVASQANLPPLYIAVDQEGGRVVRLPADFSTPFAGNMAIGATWAAHGDTFAGQTGAVIGEELALLGFNVNFAPTVDVNVNPDNPVINVRSYGEDPAMVAKLGTAQAAAMQQQGIAVAMKHFPGHGDTNVDSHTGLPRVDHDLATVEAVDLLPFAWAIEHQSPDMIMTAHIQYPQLDNSEFKTIEGDTTVVPATMSKKILTNLLRDKMGYQGLIVTDALDMAGIAHYFSPLDAALTTFRAGADIALMPYSIRTGQDLQGFGDFLDALTRQVAKDADLSAQIRRSAEAIRAHKASKQLQTFGQIPLAQHLDAIARYQRSQHGAKLEQALSDSSVVMLENRQVLPLNPAVRKIQMFMPDARRCQDLTKAMLALMPQLDIQCHSLAFSTADNVTPSAGTDLVILADISPQQSLAEMGGMDDKPALAKRSDLNAIQDRLKQLAGEFGKAGVPRLFISLRAPYIQADFADLADARLATFSYGAPYRHGEALEPIFLALAKVMAGKLTPEGQLPVSLTPTQAH